MAFERRVPVLNVSGALSAGCTALDTTITSASFADPVNPLPTITAGSPQAYVPLVLANDSQGKMEVAYVTNHVAGATTATVSRGREGTSAQPFNAGDVVRCAPTTYDFVPGFTRANLPSDGFYGMRAFVSDEDLVVERTSTGWNDSAPLKNDANRKHHWGQSGASIPTARTGLILSGVSGTQIGTTGNIATFSGGNLKLNRSGNWAISLAMYSQNSNNRTQGVEFRWPGGAFPGQSSIYQNSGAFATDICIQNLFWSGYVTAAQAAIAIGCWVNSTVVLANCQYDITAEFLGA